MAQLQYDVLLEKNTSMPIQHYPGKTDTLLLWFPGEAGITRDDVRLAKALAKNGFDVHVAGTLDARFLSALKSSMMKIPASDVATTLSHIMKKHKGRVVVMSLERGAVPTLRGLRLWMKQASPAERKRLQGVVLLSPNLYVATPQPGQDAEFLPVASGINTSIYILQPMLSPKYWWRERLQKELGKGGSTVRIEVLRGVRDRFYYRNDAIKPELDRAEIYPDILTRAIKSLPLKDKK